MDLEMPVLDGIEATSAIKAELPDVAVVMLTSFSDRERIVRALDAGAAGYLLKDAEPDELSRAIAAAARGDAPLDPKAARAPAQRPTTASGPAQLSAAGAGGAGDGTARGFRTSSSPDGSRSARRP